MAKETPPDDTEFASFDDLPKRVKQPQWRWWKQPIGIAVIALLMGTIAVVNVLNRADIVVQQPVTLLADLPVLDDTNPVVVNYRGLILGRYQLSPSRHLPDLSAGDQVCLQIKDRPFDDTPRYNLLPLDEC